MTTSRFKARRVALVFFATLVLTGCVEREDVTLIIPAGRLGDVDA